MRLIHLPTAATVLLDIAAWLMIHLGVALAATRMPVSRFRPETPLFRPRSWERAGSVYAEYCRIKDWKQHLPDGAPLLGEHGFPKKHLAESGSAYLASFARETCRAELAHWVILSFAPLFFLWNRPGIGVLMIVYAVIENLPLIIAQRYNRFRLLRLLAAREQRDERRDH